MLVLTRRETESIIIGSDVEIVVTGVRGANVQLGIIAPRSISVHRKEVYEAIRHERGLKCQGHFASFSRRNIAAAVEA